MSLDEGLAGLLTYLASRDTPPLNTATPPQARRAFRRQTCDIRPADMVFTVGAVNDTSIDGPEGPIAARIYRPVGFTPESAQTRPTVVYLHGGGFVIGDLDTHDNQARRLCREVDAVVVSVDYRLAPEHPFPAPVNDCWEATLWAAAHIADLGGDPSRLAVAGDSAGGNLAAVVARRARDAGAPAIAAQLLIYPVTDLTEPKPEPGTWGRHPSRVTNGIGYLLQTEDMEWFGEQYLAAGAPENPAEPDLSPLYGDHRGLPPAVIVTAEFDPLRDEGLALARALQEAGTEVELFDVAGMIHGFFDLGPASPAVESACSHACTLIRGMLERESSSPYSRTHSE